MDAHKHLLVATLLGALALPACALEYTQLLAEGDSCRDTIECGPGLICVDRECVQAPAAARPRDQDPSVAPRQSEEDVSDQVFPELPPPQDTPPVRPDVPPDRPDVPPDTPPDVPPRQPLCTPGESECATNRSYRTCSADGESWDSTTCPIDTYCLGAVCVARPNCSDNDGDGFPAGDDCVGEVDCNDDNATIFPGAEERCNGLNDDCDGSTRDSNLQRGCTSACGQGLQRCNGQRWPECTARQPTPEVCGNMVDDDCNGVVDDRCDECCTPGSCGDQQLCVGCDCQDAPRDLCQFQNQPCTPGVADNGQWFCLDFGGFGQEGVCVGVCQFDAPDPAATCPSPGSTCLFGEDNQGICLAGCDAASQTGCFEGQGCVGLGDGACVPAGDVDEGDFCDIDRGTFGECEAGTACIELGEPEGTCERLCNPFAAADGISDACDAGDACFPFSVDSGICVPALDLNAGDGCSRVQANSLQSMCRGQSLCTRGRDGFACQPLCRLGGDDCSGDTTCRPAPLFGDIPGVGVCR